MRFHNFRYPVQKLLAVLLLFLFAFNLRAKAGLDSYEIYLNNRLLVRQAVNQPLSLEGLQLSKSNQNDKLVIRYFQCNAPGKLAKNRIISIQDAEGKKIREWKFTDDGSPEDMVILVKDLLQLEKKNSGAALSLVYTAEGHPQAQKLTTLKLGAASTTFVVKPFMPFIATVPVSKFFHI